MKCYKGMTAMVMAAILAAAGLTGCSSLENDAASGISQNVPENTEAANPGNETEAQTSSENAADTASETVADAGEQTKTGDKSEDKSGGIAYHIEEVHDDVKEGDKKYIVPASISYPVITIGRMENGLFIPDAANTGSLDCSALQNTLNGLSEKIHQANRQAAVYEDDGSYPVPEGMSFLAESTASVTRFDDQYFCMSIHTESYAGGAHGNHATAGYNYNTATGEELKLTDVLTDPDSFPATLTKAFKEQQAAAAGFIIVDDIEKVFREEMDGTSEYGARLQWSLTEDGLDVYIGPYELTAYAAGEFTIHFTNANYPDLLKAEYRTAVSDYIQKVGVGAQNAETANIITKADGTTGKLIIDYGKELYDNYSMDSVPLDIKWENATFSIGEIHGTGELNAQVVHRGSGLFLYLDIQGDNDIHTLYICQLGDGRITEVNENSSNEVPSTDALYGAYSPNPSWVRMTDRTGMLSTAFVFHYCSVNEDGTFTPVEKYYTFDGSGQAITLTTKRAVAAKKLTDASDDEGEKTEIPQGTQLHLYRTDQSTVVDLKDDDGTVYRVTLDGTAGSYTIDGTSVDDLFDGMQYAG